MIDEEYDEQPFSFSVVMESVSNSEDLDELANIPVNEERVLESEDLALEVIVQAAGDIVSAIDEVVWAADEVRAIDDVECAADVFVRAVDEKMLLDKVVPEEVDDVPVLASVDPPTEDDSQPSINKDLGRRDDEVTEPTRLELDDNILAANDNAPAFSENPVKPIATTTPATAPIRCRFPESFLELWSPMFSSPPEFVPSIHLLQE